MSDSNNNTPKNKKLTRREIREGAFILLYQLELTGGGKAELAEVLADCAETFGLDTSAAAIKMVDGVLENKGTIDAVISKYSASRKIERIPKISLSIMRLALYEMDYVPESETPDKAAMNEAIELSKEYAYEPDSKFISGLLGAYYKQKNGQ
ncbi:MAG: transcription antitermination factor NusB [Oscillospiraceae bacterium]|nr:transcription antitermination factor NusB [Oscillospiraceae bacterium]